jgi:hypothetical protein
VGKGDIISSNVCENVKERNPPLAINILDSLWLGAFLSIADNV